MSESVKKWIFVSHSSKDILYVRNIRNYLENLGASPLLFHLLSLKNADQFWPIIKNEIRERNLFIYCDSKNADNSEWVQRERSFVKELSKEKSRKIVSIKAEENFDKNLLKSFVSDTKVFFSYYYKDRNLIDVYVKKISEEGFDVFYDARLEVGENFVERLRSELDDAIRCGWFVGFLTKNSTKSEWIQKEIMRAIEKKAKIIFVYDDDVVQFLQNYELQIQCFFIKLSDGPNKLVELILEN